MVYGQRCILLVLLGWVLVIRPALGAEGKLDEQKERRLEEAKQLHAQVEKMFRAGQYTQAIPIAEKVLAIRKEALGPRHLDVAQSLNRLGRLHHKLAQYAKAEPRFQEALAIRKEALGPRHPDVAGSLVNLGHMYSILPEDLWAKLSREGGSTRAEPHPRGGLAPPLLGVRPCVPAPVLKIT